MYIVDIQTQMAKISGHWQDVLKSTGFAIVRERVLAAVGAEGRNAPL
jgi:hypothetical protein